MLVIYYIARPCKPVEDLHIQWHGSDSGNYTENKFEILQCVWRSSEILGQTLRMKTSSILHFIMHLQSFCIRQTQSWVAWGSPWLHHWVVSLGTWPSNGHFPAEPWQGVPHATKQIPLPWWWGKQLSHYQQFYRLASFHHMPHMRAASGQTSPTECPGVKDKVRVI